MKRTVKTITALLLCLLMAGCAAGTQPQAVDVAPPVQTSGPTTPAPAAAAAAAAAAVPSPTVVAHAELANLHDFTGTVQVETGGQAMNAYQGMRLFEEDTLRTGPDSTASVDLDQGRLLMMDANTELRLSHTGSGGLAVTLLKGTILNTIPDGQRNEYTVRTANVTMGVLGTVFRISIDDATGVAITDLYEGKMLITFTTSSGQERSFVLQPGLRFTGSAENIDGSHEQDVLLTEDIYLDDLSPELLEMLKEALQERAEEEGVQELLDQIDELEQEREEQAAPSPTPEPTPVRVSTPSPTPVASPSPTARLSPSPTPADPLPSQNPMPSDTPPSSPIPPAVAQFALEHVPLNAGAGSVVSASDANLASPPAPPSANVPPFLYRIRVKVNPNQGKDIRISVSGGEVPLVETAPGSGLYGPEDGSNIPGFNNGTDRTATVTVDYTFQDAAAQITKTMEIQLGGLTSIYYDISEIPGSLYELNFGANFYPADDYPHISPPTPITGWVRAGSESFDLAQYASYSSDDGALYLPDPPVFAEYPGSVVYFSMAYNYAYAYAVDGGAFTKVNQRSTYAYLPEP